MMPISLTVWCANNGIKTVLACGWLTVNCLVFWTTYEHYKYSPQFFYLHEMLGAGLCVSRGTASLINLNLGMLVLPMCRTLTNCLRHSQYKISMRTLRTLLDRCKGFHILCAYILSLASAVHFFAHVFNALNYSRHYNSRMTALNAATEPQEDPLLIVLASVPGVTGVVLLLLLTMMISSAAPSVRSASYPLFWYTHKLYILFYLLVLVHAIRGILKRQRNVARHTPGCAYRGNGSVSIPWPESEPEPELDISHWNCVEDPAFDTIGCSSWMWVVAPLMLYACDSLYRFVRRNRTAVTLLSVTAHPAAILELQLCKQGFSCRPGQYILMQCPRISAFEWHPYTVSRCPTEPGGHFTVHIKGAGDWSEKLNDVLLEEDSDVDATPLLSIGGPQHRFHIDGPFSSPLEDVLRYKISLCVAGGIGITPFAAILNYLRHHAADKLQRLYLVWICREVQSYLCFADLICDTFTQYWENNRPDLFDVQLFITSPRRPCIEETISRRYSIMTERIVFGKPCWQQTLQRVATAHPRTTVGVFSCGPKSLSLSVEKWCARIQSQKTSFLFHHESF